MYRRFFFATTTTVFMAVIGASALGDNPRRTAYFTFNTPIELPGVSLPAGTYVFELVDSPSTACVVHVLSRQGAHLYMGLTRDKDRPANLKASQITFAEVPRGATPRLSTWYPLGDVRGHQFMY